MARFDGTEGNDFITGTAFGDTLYGYGGHDYLNGSGGEDVVVGGAGADRLFGGIANDTLVGGEGADELNGGSGSDAAFYGVGWGDTPVAGVAVDLAAGVGSGGEAAGDSYAGIESVVGSPFDDVITGSDVNNSLQGGGGDDHLIGGEGWDELVSGPGNDWLEGGAGHDALIATLSDGAILDGGAGDDFIYPGLGPDTIIGGDGTDLLHFGNIFGTTVPPVGVTADLKNGTAGETYSGIENIFGSAYDDDFTGDEGRNRIDGIGGNDALDGRLGHDVLDGGAGDDRITGGGGNDFLRGGSGADSFVLTEEAGSRDRIVDFDSGEGDRLEFTADLSAYSGIHDFASFLARAEETAEGVYVDLNGDRPWTFGVLIADAELANLTQGDLTFA